MKDIAKMDLSGFTPLEMNEMAAINGGSVWGPLIKGIGNGLFKSFSMTETVNAPTLDDPLFYPNGSLVKYATPTPTPTPRPKLDLSLRAV